MRCRPCGKRAIIEIRRHNAAFCEACFFNYYKNQLNLALDKEKMFSAEDKVLVAVSGGKDSLALWDILLELGFNAWGLHLNLGLGKYAEKSQKAVETFAQTHQADLILIDLKNEYGWGILDISSRTTRTPCSACGLLKRYLFNKMALDGEFTVIATGHNLDDEAASLLGNVLRWQEGYLGRQNPVLPTTHPQLVRKVKPLFRLTERETAAYCVLKKIPYVVEECPLVKGATSLRYKEALNLLEKSSPGTKQSFYFEFLLNFCDFLLSEGG